jgi:hypothetical protein
MKRALVPALLLALSVLPLVPLHAQTTGPVPVPAAAGLAYQFMQFTALQGAPGYLSFSPEFNGQKVVKLDDVYMNQLYSARQRLTLQANEEVVMRWLQDITAAGWELVQVSSQPIQEVSNREFTLTKYLFRKAK